MLPLASVSPGPHAASVFPICTTFPARVKLPPQEHMSEGSRGQCRWAGLPSEAGLPPRWSQERVPVTPVTPGSLFLSLLRHQAAALESDMPRAFAADTGWTAGETPRGEGLLGRQCARRILRGFWTRWSEVRASFATSMTALRSRRVNLHFAGDE